MKTKPFNLEEALSGKPIITRNGACVSGFYHIDAPCYPIFCYSAYIGVELNPFAYNAQGQCDEVYAGAFDLFMLVEDESTCKPSLQVPDLVNHPSHYTHGDIECIDAIRSALGYDGFISYCRGQVIKYAWRAGLKDDESEDYAKAAWYATKASEITKGI